MKLFLQKNAKFLSAGGSPPDPPNSPPPLRISGYAPDYMLFIIYQTFGIRYGISLFIFGIRNSLFICVIRYSFALFEAFFRIPHFCSVTNRMLLYAPFLTENSFDKNEIFS